MTEYELIKRALQNAGYDCTPNESNLIQCFMDYLDTGAWGNLDEEEVNELTVIEMCNALIRL